MCEIKRGVVMLIQAGDPEICDPLKAGILAGREKAKEDLIRPASRATFPTGGRLLETEPVDWGEVAKLVRVAVGNTKTQEDYLIMRAAAEQEYSVRSGGALRRLAEALTVAYGLIVCGLSAAFHAQDRILRG